MPFRACRAVFFSGGADARERFLLFPERRLQHRVHLFGGIGLQDTPHGSAHKTSATTVYSALLSQRAHLLRTTRQSTLCPLLMSSTVGHARSLATVPQRNCLRHSSTLFSQPDGCGNHAPDRSQGFCRARGYEELIFTVRVSNLHLQFSVLLLWIIRQSTLANEFCVMI